jgi:Holliday junction DNA helicase RuvB
VGRRVLRVSRVACIVADPFSAGVGHMDRRASLLTLEHIVRNINVTVDNVIRAAFIDDAARIIYVPDGRGGFHQVPAAPGSYHAKDGKPVGSTMESAAAKMGLSLSPKPKAKPVAVKPVESKADRPRSVVDMVGQDRVRTQLTVRVRGAQARGTALPHVLLTGPPGLGKTSLAELVATETGGRLVRAIGSALATPILLAKALAELSKDRVDVLFVDEVHELTSAVEELLYTCLEDGRLEIASGSGAAARVTSVQLPRFILVGATTLPGRLSQPFRDRFGLQLALDYYSEDELSRIITGAAKRKGATLGSGAADALARRGRGTPRVALRLFEGAWDYSAAMTRSASNPITVDDVNAALDLDGIDSLGLDAHDRAVLDCVCRIHKGGPVGLTNLANSCGVDSRTLDSMVEPYLIRAELLRRTQRGRVATEKAFTHLGLVAPITLGDLGEATPPATSVEPMPSISLPEAVEAGREPSLADVVAQLEAADGPAPVEAAGKLLGRIPSWTEPDRNTFDEPAVRAPAPVLAAPVEPTIGDLIATIDRELGAERDGAPFVADPVAERSRTAGQDEVATLAYAGEPVGAANRLNTTLVFSMTSLPVGLYPLASDTHGPETHGVHDRDGGRIKYVRTCATCGEVVEPSEIGRAHKGHGGTLSVTAGQRASLDVDSPRELTVSAFVPASSVDPALFNAHYALRPGKSGDKAYVLLRDVLHAQGKVAVVRTVLRTTESVAVVRADGEHLILTTLIWHDQVRLRPAAPAGVTYTDAELTQATAAVEALSAGKFDHSAHRDARVQRLAELLGKAA